LEGAEGRGPLAAARGQGTDARRRPTTPLATEPKEPELKPKESEPKNSIPYSIPDIEEPK